MLHHLRGILIARQTDRIIIEAGGLGYEVLVSPKALVELQARALGEEILIYVHHHVREDEERLYGFLGLEERRLFEALLGVSGVGPTLALAAVSGLDHAALVAAVQAGDVERLVKIKGIGRKTAQRIVLELSGKLPEDLLAAPARAAAPRAAVRDEAVLAMLALGFARPQAEQAVEGARAALSPGAPTQDVVRRALLAETARAGRGR